MFWVGFGVGCIIGVFLPICLVGVLSVVREEMEKRRTAGAGEPTSLPLRNPLTFPGAGRFNRFVGWVRR